MFKYSLLISLAILTGCGGGDDNPPVNRISNVNLTWSDQFSFFEGPFDADTGRFESQSLMIIVTENNNIICQVTFEPLSTDIGSTVAFMQVEANSTDATFSSITSVSVNTVPAQEAVSFFTEDNGTFAQSLGRWYYFSASELPGENSFFYTLRCVTPVDDFTQNETVIRNFLDSAVWVF